MRVRALGKSTLAAHRLDYIALARRGARRTRQLNNLGAGISNTGEEVCNPIGCFVGSCDQGSIELRDAAASYAAPRVAEQNGNRRLAQSYVVGDARKRMAQAVQRQERDVGLRRPNARPRLRKPPVGRSAETRGRST